MRSYLEIIIDLQDGKEVDYEEARLAALAGNYMLKFSEMHILRLYEAKGNTAKSEFMLKLAVDAYEKRFKSVKLPIDEYLGSFHPDSPGRQEERKIHQNIYDKFMKDKSDA